MVKSLTLNGMGYTKMGDDKVTKSIIGSMVWWSMEMPMQNGMSKLL